MPNRLDWLSADTGKSKSSYLLLGGLGWVFNTYNSIPVNVSSITRSTVFDKSISSVHSTCSG